MKHVIYNGPSVSVDVPKEKERSVEGALHFQKGGSRTLSEDEYAYIEVYRKDIFKNLVLVKDGLATPKSKVQGSSVKVSNKSSKQKVSDLPAEGK